MLQNILYRDDIVIRQQLMLPYQLESMKNRLTVVLHLFGCRRNSKILYGKICPVQIILSCNDIFNRRTILSLLKCKTTNKDILIRNRSCHTL